MISRLRFATILYLAFGSVALVFVIATQIANVLNGAVPVGGEVAAADAHAEEARRAAEVQQNAWRRTVILDVFALGSAGLLAMWVLRRFREHDKLLADHAELQEQRAAELEVFAQRVAHDLISPLASLTYCLGAFKRVSETDPKLEEALARANTCVVRARDMVHGIFEFARAGGKPEPGAYADVREVLEQMIEEVREAEASQAPEVIVEPFVSCFVASSSAVLASVLANLLYNATKYMRDSALKRITVRVRERESDIRIEIADTGPGIPRGLEQRIFEPYVRGEGVTQKGLGLGLATVKRLCEAHSGKVGVRSRPGEGSVFWFTLPKASGVSGGYDSLPPSLTLRSVNRVTQAAHHPPRR